LKYKSGVAPAQNEWGGGGQNEKIKNLWL